jgi:dihydrofolate reductase
MGKVILDMSISLDGYITPANEEDGVLHNWYFGSSDKENQQVIAESIDTIGAIIMGRRTYNLGDQFDGFVDIPYKVTHFVLTHHAPEKPAKASIPFVFVHDGIESALQQARAVAGDKDIAIGGGASTARQFLRSGLLDEIQFHIIPVILGEGLRLFDDVALERITLERTRLIEAPGVTHLQFRIVR